STPPKAISETERPVRPKILLFILSILLNKTFLYHPLFYQMFSPYPYSNSSIQPHQLPYSQNDTPYPKAPANLRANLPFLQIFHFFLLPPPRACVFLLTTDDPIVQVHLCLG